jgi:anti-sigma B factor antagonist
MPSKFDIVIRELPDVYVVALIGELDLATSEDLSGQLMTIAGSTVVIDLSQLTFMDSTGIGALVMARNRIMQEGHRLVLTRPQGIVGRALEIVGLDDWVEEWSPDWSE